MEAWLYALISAQDGGKSSALCYSHFVPGERNPGIHRISDLVGSRVGLNITVKKKFLHTASCLWLIARWLRHIRRALEVTKSMKETCNDSLYNEITNITLLIRVRIVPNLCTIKSVLMCLKCACHKENSRTGWQLMTEMCIMALHN